MSKGGSNMLFILRLYSLTQTARDLGGTQTIFIKPSTNYIEHHGFSLPIISRLHTEERTFLQS